MARVSLKNVQVSKVFQDGRAAEVVETYTSQGREAKQKYTLWFNEAHGLGEGSIVDVEGLLSAKLREFESETDGTVRFIQLSVNYPTVKVTDVANVNRVGHAAVNQVWPEVASPGKVETLVDGAPF